MATGYFVQKLYTQSASIAEISYEKETDRYVTGVEKVRDILGRAYYIPSRVNKADVFDSLSDVVSAVRKQSEARVQREQNLQSQLDSLVSAIADA